MVYEAMLLFGVLFMATLLFSILLEQRHALYLRHVLQCLLFLLTGCYFVWFWIHKGQTLPMKTWRICLVNHNGEAVRTKKAIARYLLAWLWFVPGLAVAWMLGAKTWILITLPIVNILVWALTIYLDPQRQFLHDRIAGTRLITVEAQTRS